MVRGETLVFHFHGADLQRLVQATKMATKFEHPYEDDLATSVKSLHMVHEGHFYLMNAFPMPANIRPLSAHSVEEQDPLEYLGDDTVTLLPIDHIDMDAVISGARGLRLTVTDEYLEIDTYTPAACA